MSSHHIVREKQEPALYIHHLGQFDEEYLGQLLEWSPALIVSAASYEKVMSLGLKVDMVVNADQPFDHQENTDVLTLKSGKPELDLVLDHLIAQKFPAVNVIDDTHRLRDLGQYIEQIDIVVFTETEKAYAIRSGFSVWKPRGSIFRIEVLAYFETENLMQEENGDFVVLHDGFVRFTFNVPFLFISEVL